MKTIKDLEDAARRAAGAAEYRGHKYADLERYADGITHMIIYDDARGERCRAYLSDEGYQRALRSGLAIVSHATVTRGRLKYDVEDMPR